MILAIDPWATAIGFSIVLLTQLHTAQIWKAFYVEKLKPLWKPSETQSKPDVEEAKSIALLESPGRVVPPVNTSQELITVDAPHSGNWSSCI